MQVSLRIVAFRIVRGIAGGSFAFADPETQVGYAYASMKMGYCNKKDPREETLRDAFYRCLEKMGN